jgi:hypothetical protein
VPRAARRAETICIAIALNFMSLIACPRSLHDSAIKIAEERGPVWQGNLTITQATCVINNTDTPVGLASGPHCTQVNGFRMEEGICARGHPRDVSRFDPEINQVM